MRLYSGLLVSCSPVPYWERCAGPVTMCAETATMVPLCCDLSSGIDSVGTLLDVFPSWDGTGKYVDCSVGSCFCVLLLS